MDKANSEIISELIEQYLVLIRDSHHKSKDGYFWIDKTWRGYDNSIIPRYRAIHQGYLNELDGPERYTEEAAEQDMIKFLEEIIKDWQENDYRL